MKLLLCIPSLVIALSSPGIAGGLTFIQAPPVRPAPPAEPPVATPPLPSPPRTLSTAYSIGDPTDSEQLYLEYINRARANPSAEALRIINSTDPWILASIDQYRVNLTLFLAELTAIPPRPPLAMNEKLLQAARAHTQDQFNRGIQTHNSVDGSTPQQRMLKAGYPTGLTAENIYAYSIDEWYGHAGFETDWGPGGVGGMQAGRGHRVAIHNPAFREVGIGVIFGKNTVNGDTVGPQLVTQDFSVLNQNAVPIVTGVAYYDLNGNSFYDPGEGLGGVNITVSGSSFQTVTAASGGYAVPVAPGDGPRTVSFTGLGFNVTSTALITDGGNVKVDLIPVYAGPVVSGPAAPGTRVATTYTWPAVPGADSYELRAMQRVPAADDAADSLARVVPDVAGFTPISTAVKFQGTSSYRLVHEDARTNALTYPGAFLAGPGATLRFHSRLRWAAIPETARAQVSTNGGTTWTDVYTQAGTDSSGESAFKERVVSLASLAGKEFMLRFAFTESGGFFPPEDTGDGWHIDNIRFTDILDASGGTVIPTPVNAANFTAPSNGEFLLSARAMNGGRRFPNGPTLTVNAVIRAGLDFAAWAAREEVSANLLPGSLANPAADFNGDGIPNLTAYLMGLGGGRASLPVPVSAVGAANLIIFDYPRYTAAAQGTLTVQISTDLQKWHAPGDAGGPAGFTDAKLSLDGEIETRRATVPAAEGVRYYFRLRAETP